MKDDLSPDAVARRLARLRALTEPRDVPFAEGVAKRLEELRALCDLTTYLHRRRERTD